jgi:hypothetical protein
VNYRSFGKRWYDPILKKVLPSWYLNHHVDYLMFGQFTRMLLEGGEWFRSDEHWQPQHRLCHPCQIHYDYIAKFESLETDALRLLRLFNASVDSVSTINKATEMTNPTGYRKLGTTRSFGELSRNTVESLQELYKTDFQVFKYNWSDNTGSMCNAKNTTYCC